MELSGLLPRIHRSAPRESELTGARYPLLRLSPPPLYTVIGFRDPSEPPNSEFPCRNATFVASPARNPTRRYGLTRTHTDEHGPRTGAGERPGGAGGLGGREEPASHCGTDAPTGHFYFHRLRLRHSAHGALPRKLKTRVYPRPCRSVFVRVGPCARVSPVTLPAFIVYG